MIQPSLGESERRNGRSEEDANQMQLTSPVTKMVLGAILSVTTEAIYIYIYETWCFTLLIRIPYTPLFMLGGLTKSGYWYWSSTIPKLESWESASKMGTQQKPSCVIKLGQFIIYRVLTLHLVQKNLPFID